MLSHCLRKVYEKSELRSSHLVALLPYIFCLGCCYSEILFQKKKSSLSNLLNDSIFVIINTCSEIMQAHPGRIETKLKPRSSPQCPVSHFFYSLFLPDHLHVHCLEFILTGCQRLLFHVRDFQI